MFQRHLSVGQLGSGLLRHHSSGLPSGPHPNLPHHASTGNLFDQGGLNIPTMGPRGSAAGLGVGHRMAASHSPYLEEGLLAQSLESHLPAFPGKFLFTSALTLACEWQDGCLRHAVW